MTTEAEIAALRAFNRTYTRKLGLLNPRLDDSPFSLTEARVLYEIAHRDGPTAAEITRALDLDPAQMSRTLKRFGERGLVETTDHPDGGRSRRIVLTSAGANAFAALDRNTHVAIAGLLDSLSPSARANLLDAARTIGQVFAPAPAPAGPVALRDLKPGDLGWIIHRQAVLYAQEYDWNQDYEALVCRILADFAAGFDPAREAAWVAELDGRVVGSIFLVKGDAPDVGKLRLLYVEPDTRGAGVGGALIAACIERARAVGYGTLTLWTNSVLSAARRLYERAGFVLVDEVPHKAFGKDDLVSQTWSLKL